MLGTRASFVILMRWLVVHYGTLRKREREREQGVCELMYSIYYTLSTRMNWGYLFFLFWPLIITIAPCGWLFPSSPKRDDLWMWQEGFLRILFSFSLFFAQQNMEEGVHSLASADVPPGWKDDGRPTNSVKDEEKSSLIHIPSPLFSFFLLSFNKYGWEKNFSVMRIYTCIDARYESPLYSLTKMARAPWCCWQIAALEKRTSIDCEDERIRREVGIPSLFVCDVITISWNMADERSTISPSER